MKQLIALRGPANCGKTSTLKELISTLAIKANKVYRLSRRNGKVTLHDDFDVTMLTRRRDIAVIMEYPNEKKECPNGKPTIKIGISTYGDPPLTTLAVGAPMTAAEIYLRYLVGLQGAASPCDIIFCGCRPEPDITVVWVNTYGSGYDIRFVKQTIERDIPKQVQSNRDVAQSLIVLAGI